MGRDQGGHGGLGANLSERIQSVGWRCQQAQQAAGEIPPSWGASDAERKKELQPTRMPTTAFSRAGESG